MLKGEDFSSFISTIPRLEYHPSGRAESADAFWGVMVADGDSIPEYVKTTIMAACLRVPTIWVVATALRGDKFFHSIFIYCMCGDDAIKQQRQDSSGQHPWHTDEACSNSSSFFTVVYTIYNGQSDSDAVTAHEVGEVVGMSNQDDSIFVVLVMDSLRHPSHGQLPPITQEPIASTYFLVILFLMLFIRPSQQHCVTLL